MRSPLLEIGAAFERARPYLERDLPLLLPVGVAFLLLPQLLLARFAGTLPPVGPAAGDVPLCVVVGLGAAAVSGLLFQIFLTIHVLRVLPGGTIAALLGSAARLVPSGLIIGFVQALAIVPAVALLSSGRPALALLGLALAMAGAWVVVRLMPAVPVLVVEGGGPFRAIARSWALTSGHSVRLSAMVLVLLLSFLCFLLLLAGLGSAIASVVTLVAGEPSRGWGAGRWVAEIIEAGASSLLSASLAVFVALVYRLLAARG